jgi:hypothetical protein
MEINFNVFVSGLMAEGLIALGAMKNPMTKETKKDLEHASQVIEVIGMLQEKTKGNLTEEESKGLEEVLHQLRMLYVAETSEKKDEK